MKTNDSHSGHSSDDPSVEPYRSSVSPEHEEGALDPEVDGETRRHQLWMAPALIILAIVWFLVTVPGKIAPMTMFHFFSLQGGPAIGTLGIAIWWLAARKLSWRSRLVGVGLGFAILVGAVMSVHQSMQVVTLIWGLPIALTFLVMTLLLGENLAWPKRGWAALGAFAGALLVAQFFRTADMDAAFGFRLVPRWSPTAEDKMLAELESEQTPAQDGETSIELSEHPSDSDWAEFRGSRRDGILREVTFDSDWDTNPPQEIWRRPVGPGWSSFCVLGSTFFTQEQRGEKEAVVAYDLDSGSPIWMNEIEARFEASMGGIGPRGTPTYDRGQLFVMGATGVVQCLSASSGETVWKHDLVKQSEVRLPEWGFASSPLIVDDLVMVFAGGGVDQDSGKEKGVVALNRADGSVVWTASDGWHGYSSPQLVTIEGVRQVLIISNVGIHSLEPESGKVLWKHRWDIGQMARVTQPLVVANAIYIGTGYGNGTQRIDVKHSDGKWEVSEAWIANLKPYFNDFVHHQGHVYGFDGPIFMSVDAETGDKNWKGGRFGHGQVLLVEDMAALVIVGEKGDLVLADANPDKFRKIAEFQAMDGISWNHPVIADGKLLVRNSQEMVCYALKGYRRRAVENGAAPEQPAEP